MVDEVILTPTHLPRDYGIEHLMSPQGRHLLIAPVAGTALYALKWKEGGDLPPNLKGRYTSVSNAMTDAKKYLHERWDNYDAECEKAFKKHSKATRMGIHEAKKRKETEQKEDSE